jgi:hypothetical protein
VVMLMMCCPTVRTRPPPFLRQQPQSWCLGWLAVVLLYTATTRAQTTGDHCGSPSDLASSLICPFMSILSASRRARLAAASASRPATHSDHRSPTSDSAVS